MSKLIKREIPLIITFVVGMIVILDYFIKVPMLSTIASKIMTWNMIIGGTMVGLGAINIFRYNIRAVRRRTSKGWPFNLWLMIGIVFMFILGVFGGVITGTAVSQSPLFLFFYSNVVEALKLAIKSLYGFYIMSAVIHSLQIRNKESIFLMFGAVLIILWSAPLGPVIWEGFLPLGTWISSNLVGSIFRGITISMAIGIVALGLRTLLGMETGLVGVEEE